MRAAADAHAPTLEARYASGAVDWRSRRRGRFQAASWLPGSRRETNTKPVPGPVTAVSWPAGRSGKLSRIGDALEGLNQPISFVPHDAPCGIGLVEASVAAHFFECARRGDDGLCLEVGGGAFQCMGCAPQTIGVLGLDRLLDFRQVPRRIVDEEARDFSQQLAVAADTSQHLRG